MPSEKPSGVSRRDFLASVSVASAAAMSLPSVAYVKAPVPPRAPDGATIAKVGIYPPVGISRVGNSKEAHFFAPEVPGTLNNAQHLLSKDGHIRLKDLDGRIKKQVQRFRLYGFDNKGRVVKELKLGDPDVSQISWSVHVANAKAAWYGFTNPMNLGTGAPPIPTLRRNDSVVGDDRKKLIINPEPQTVEGANDSQVLEGTFWGKFSGSRPIDNHPVENVKLGELRTDDEGHLLVFPADGDSRSVTHEQAITNFTDNDGWRDDWCDGWVKAEVKLSNGQMFSMDEVEHGWIACVGPNFAPEIPPVVSLYDQAKEVMLRKGWLKARKKPLFTQDIYPFFNRLGLMDWLTSAAHLRQGWADVGDFKNPNYIAKLADNGESNKAFRENIFKQVSGPNNLRNNATCPYKEKDTNKEPNKNPMMPFLIGGGVNYDNSPHRYYMMPEHYYSVLQQWANGDFVNDWAEHKHMHYSSIEEVPLEQQPRALSRAALEPCSGTGFHPGVELTWYMQMEKTYEGLFRISMERTPSARPGLLQDFGHLLTPEKVYCGDGSTPPAIGPQMPGDLTRWMGLPWQPDAFSCQQVNYAKDFPTITWWPALLPIDVIPEAYYDFLMDSGKPYQERIKFYQNRVPWARGAAGLGYHAEASYSDGLNNMVQLWGEMGFVVKKKGPAPPPEIQKMLKGKKGKAREAILQQFWIPEELYVEVERGTMDMIYNSRTKWPNQEKR